MNNLREHPKRPGLGLNAGLFACVSLFLLIAGACGVETKQPPDIVLISLDTVKRDVLGCYAGGEMTPNLDALAERSVVYTDIFAPMPFTLTSHMSMLTGLYPDAHAVGNERSRLSPSALTLSTRLKDAGYTTIGVFSSEWLKEDYGFGRGFDHYERVPHRLTFADRITNKALTVIDQLRMKDKPLFLFLHYYDAHSDFGKQGDSVLPYYSEPEIHGERPLGPQDFCDSDNNCATRFMVVADRDNRAVAEEKIAELEALYEFGVYQLDRDLGFLFDELEKRGLFSNAVVIVTSDHGEEFREHGKFLHSQVYDESVAVPMIINLPGNKQAGTKIAVPGSIIDIYPTILQLAGLSAPSESFAQPLSLTNRDEPATQNPVLVQDKLIRSRYGLIEGPFKFITDIKNGGPELFDRDKDPAELHNLVAQMPDLATEMRDRLYALVDENHHIASALRAATESETVDDLSEEEKERLRALGYLQ